MPDLEGLPPGLQEYIEHRQVEVEPDRSRICPHDTDEERAACEKCDRGLLAAEPVSNLPEWFQYHESWAGGTEHPRDPMLCPECRRSIWRGRPA